MKKIQVAHGNRNKLLNLVGEKIYRIKATVETIKIMNPSQENESRTRINSSVLYHEFISTKKPKEIISNVEFFLNGFEVANIRIDALEYLTNKIACVTLGSVENIIEILIFVEDGRYFEGRLEVFYDSLHNNLLNKLLKQPNSVTDWSKTG